MIDFEGWVVVGSCRFIWVSCVCVCVCVYVHERKKEKKSFCT